jgi:hypothetical protein
MIFHFSALCSLQQKGIKMGGLGCKICNPTLSYFGNIAILGAGNGIFTVVVIFECQRKN